MVPLLLVASVLLFTPKALAEITIGPNLTLSEVAAPSGTVQPGDTITYTITLDGNPGDVAEGTLVSTWSFGTSQVATYVDGSASPTAVVDTKNHTVTWAIDSESVPLTFTYQLMADASDPSGTYAISSQAVFTPAVGIQVGAEQEEALSSAAVTNSVTYQAVTPQVLGASTSDLPVTGADYSKFVGQLKAFLRK